MNFNIHTKNLLKTYFFKVNNQVPNIKFLLCLIELGMIFKSVYKKEVPYYSATSKFTLLKICQKNISKKIEVYSVMDFCKRFMQGGKRQRMICKIT